MGRFNFTAPGAAATEALKAALLQNEAQRRQALMDSIGVKREDRLAKADDINAQEAQARLAQTNLATQSLVQQRDAAAEKSAVDMAERTQKIGDVASPDTPVGLTQGRTLASTHTMAPLGLPALAGYPMPSVPDANATAGGSEVTPPLQTTTHEAIPGMYTGTVKQRGQKNLVESTADPAMKQKLQALFDSGANVGGEDVVAMFKPPTPEKQPRNLWVDRHGKRSLMTPQGLAPLPADFVDRPEDVQHHEPAAPGGNTIIQPTMDDSTLTFFARQYLQDKVMPNFGQGQAAAKMRNQFMAKVSEMANETGVNPVANAADLGADKAALNQAQKQYTAVKSFKETARKNIDVLKTALKDTPDVGIPILDQPWRKLLQMTGDKRMAKFQAALGTVQPEISRILNSANLTGVNTVHAQEEVNKILSPSATVGQMLESLGVLEQDMDNRETSMIDQITNVRTRISDRDPLKPKDKPSDESPAARKARLAKQYGIGQ